MAAWLRELLVRMNVGNFEEKEKSADRK